MSRPGRRSSCSREKLNQPVGRLSGGRTARVLIAQLMLEPADVLLLDEPTNDLDIPTLEILEESLLEFRGALVLVTHDRFMLDRVSTVVLGLDGLGGAERFADYSQWDVWQRLQQAQAKSVAATTSSRPSAAGDAGQRWFSQENRLFKEVREFASIEERIAEAEGAHCASNRLLRQRIRRPWQIEFDFKTLSPRCKKHRNS